MMPLYVYAVTGSAAAPFEAAGQRIEFRGLDGIFVAATTMTAMPQLTEAALREQHDVVGAIAARVDALLPARFGSLVEPPELEQVVALRREAIGEALVLVSGCEQMTVRAFGDPAPPRAQAAQPPTTGTAYLERRADAELRLPASVRLLAAAVQPLVRAERIVRGERGIVATLYHLVPRGTSADYAQALEPLRAGFPGPGFIVSGPWPPFAFAPELWA